MFEIACPRLSVRGWFGWLYYYSLSPKRIKIYEFNAVKRSNTTHEIMHNYSKMIHFDSSTQAGRA